MTQIRRQKSSFASGELSPELFGRADLRAYENGAASLRNVVIFPAGGVRRRPGLRHVARIDGGPGRLVAFEFNTEQTYLLLFQSGRMRVFQDETELASVATPWTEAQLAQLAFTQSADTLLLAHPDLPPRRVTRTGPASWAIDPWPLDPGPMHRFGAEQATLAASAISGAITLAASEPVFDARDTGTFWRIHGVRVRIDAVVSSTQAAATTLEDLPNTDPTADWEEPAWSERRGWPVSLCFHQARLVVGGSRDLPNRLWLSRTGDLFNFDLGEGLDDEAIDFALVSDQVNAIRNVFSGRHLQVFTSGTEWMVTGDPLTPSSIQLVRQTRIGSPLDRQVPPVDVDGATLFVARTGRALHEFAYDDVELAYQSNDLALVARHLIDRPVAMAYDQVGRLLHIAMADGTLATLTIYRAEQVTAWTRTTTDGAFRSLAEIDGRVYALTERAGGRSIEVFDPSFAVDAGLAGTSSAPRGSWDGLEHLEGRTVAVLGDGAPRGTQTVRGGAVTLDPPASVVQAGLPFAHVIEPLPPELSSAIGVRGGPVRLVSLTLRMLDTSALELDLGQGRRPVPLRRLGQGLLDTPLPRFSGDVTVRSLGWRRPGLEPLWRIEGSAPLPLTLLSVTVEMRIND